jgi:hypothetical protein
MRIYVCERQPMISFREDVLGVVGKPFTVFEKL